MQAFFMDINTIEKFRLALVDDHKKSNLNKTQYAAKLGISAAYLNQLISGKRTGERKILELAPKIGFKIPCIEQTNEEISHLAFKKDLDATKDKLKLTEDNAAAYKELFEKYKEENERLTAENKTLRAENEALKKKLAGPDCQCGEGLKKRRAV